MCVPALDTSSTSHCRLTTRAHRAHCIFPVHELPTTTITPTGNCVHLLALPILHRRQCFPREERLPPTRISLVISQRPADTFPHWHRIILALLDNAFRRQAPTSFWLRKRLGFPPPTVRFHVVHRYASRMSSNLNSTSATLSASHSSQGPSTTYFTHLPLLVDG